MHFQARYRILPSKLLSVSPLSLSVVSVDITLAWYEVFQASEIGRMRKIISMQKGSANNHGFSGSGWNEDIEGACAELAVAKSLNRYWEGGIDTYKAGDVGDYQVRWSASHNNSLIVRSADADDAVFILATGVCPTYRVQGWMRGRDAKQDQWSRQPNGRPPAFFVPGAALQPLSTLPMADGVLHV